MPFSRITLQEIDNYIEAINRASDFDQVLDLLQRQINILGFEKMTYWLRWHRNDTRNPVLLSTYPEKFLKYYAEENFQNHDMVGTYSNFTSTPFAWSDIGKKFEITRKQKILFHDSSSVGLRSGGSIPIHGPGLVKATFSVSNDERDMAIKSKPLTRSNNRRTIMKCLLQHHTTLLQKSKLSSTHCVKRSNISKAFESLKNGALKTR